MTNSIRNIKSSDYSKLRSEMIREYKSNRSILNERFFNLSDSEISKLKLRNEKIRIDFNL